MCCDHQDYTSVSTRATYIHGGGVGGLRKGGGGGGLELYPFFNVLGRGYHYYCNTTTTSTTTIKPEIEKGGPGEMLQLCLGNARFNSQDGRLVATLKHSTNKHTTKQKTYP